MSLSQEHKKKKLPKPGSFFVGIETKQQKKREIGEIEETLFYNL